MSPQEETIYDLFDNMWNSQKLEVADNVFESNATFFMPTGECLELNEFKSLVSDFFIAFPDIVHSIEDYIEEEYKIAVRWHGQGTHQGTIMGIPATGKVFSYSGITIFHFGESNKILTIWIYNNFSEMLTELR